MAATAKVIDLTNVKEGGEFNTKRVPAGDYLAKITKVVDAESKKDETFQYIFTIVLQSHSQNKYPYYCKLQENQLWKLRNLAVAAGLNVPKKRVKFDPNKVVNKTIGVTMEDDEYEGKLKSVVASVFPASELAEGSFEADDEGPEDEEYEDTADDEVEDTDVEDEAEEEADEEAGDEFDDMDRAALKRYIQGKDSSATFKKSQTDDDLREIARGLGDTDEADEDEEDEEEEPAPPPAKKATAKKTAKKAAPKPPADDDELEELDIDDI